METASCNFCHEQYYLDFNNISGHGKGAKLQMDKKTLHSCKQQNVVQVVQQLPTTARERSIDELAVTRTAAIERIAAALEKNNNQNIADALYYMSQSITDLAQAIKALVEKETST